MVEHSRAAERKGGMNLTAGLSVPPLLELVNHVAFLHALS